LKRAGHYAEREEGREEGGVKHLLEEGRAGLVVEGREAAEHPVHAHPQRPEVHLPRPRLTDLSPSLRL
jgi:hypothetical protein